MSTASARIKAASIRVRNNRIEALVSSLHGPTKEGDSVLLTRDIPPEVHRQRWNEAMELIAEQFSQIKELEGMLS